MGEKLPKHLIIPDAHAHPDHDNQRFEALGRLIVDEHPDVVICIGDFADMPSLSSYDRGKKSFEGRRYSKDVEAVIDAQERLFAPIRRYNRQAHKNRRLAPKFKMALGNHEYRIVRASEDDPRWDGTVGIENLRYADYGWEVHRFLEPFEIDGIAYAHFFASGVAGRPISGENIGKTLCNKLHQSSVQGHSHVYDHSERTVVTGRKIFGLSCGYFGHPEMIADWNRATAQMWWNGIVVLDELDGAGYYDQLKAITQRKLVRDYL